MGQINDQSGATHFVIIAVVAIAAIIGFVGIKVARHSVQRKDDVSKRSESSEGARGKEQNSIGTTQEPDIALQNIGLENMSRVDITQNAVLEFKNKGLKGFYIFGDKLSGGRQNPNFEFASIKEGSKVISAIDGVIGFIKEQPESNDFEVIVQPKDQSVWTIAYDHLTNLSVKKGDVVKSGMPLGEPSRQNNGLLRFEIQINKDINGQTTHYCPSSLLAPKVKDTILSELSTMQQSWEATTKLELYDTMAQSPVGCIKPTLSPTDAEGR